METWAYLLQVGADRLGLQLGFCLGRLASSNTEDGIFFAVSLILSHSTKEEKHALIVSKRDQ